MDKSSYFQLLNPIILLIFAGGFAAIYRSDRRLESAWWLGVGYATGAFGFVMDFFVRDAAGPYLGSYVSNVPFMLGLVLISTAIAVRYGRPVPWMLGAIVFAGTISAMSVALLFDPHSFHRGRTLERFLLAVVALSVLQSFVRPLVVAGIVGVHEDAVTYSNSLYALTLHLVSAICAISLAVTLFFALGMDLVRNLHRRAD